MVTLNVEVRHEGTGASSSMSPTPSHRIPLRLPPSYTRDGRSYDSPEHTSSCSKEVTLKLPVLILFFHFK